MAGIGKALGVAGAKARAFAAVMVLLAAAAATNPAQAAPLDLTLQPTPDIMSDFIDVAYDTTKQSFTARGFAEEISTGNGDPVIIENGVFEISATITNGGEVVAGTLTVSGAVPSLGIGKGTLVSGKMRSVGTGEDGGPMELQFDTDGGGLAFDFGPVINVILSQSGFGGDFTRNFNSPIAVAGTGW